jgi:hypothetical protein
MLQKRPEPDKQLHPPNHVCLFGAERLQWCNLLLLGRELFQTRVELQESCPGQTIEI